MKLKDFEQQLLDKWTKQCTKCGATKAVGYFFRDKSHKTGRQPQCKSCLHANEDFRLSRVWKSMNRRCKNAKDNSYRHYGGRGIKVCEEWRSLDNFRRWAKANRYKDGLELDRKNNNGDYSPSNCRFVTKAENNQNSRNVKLSPRLVSDIRIRYSNGGYTQKDLACIYRVKLLTISRIIRRVSWRNIK